MDEDTPHFLNPEVLNRGEEPEIDLGAEEFTDDTEEPEEERGSAGTKPFETEQLETVLNQGLSFLNSLSQMTTGKALVGEGSDKVVEINKETGEVTLKFKLPGF